MTQTRVKAPDSSVHLCKMAQESAISVRVGKTMRGVGVLVIVVSVMLVLAMAATGYLAPARLSMIQEHSIGLVRGGVIDTQESYSVETCVPIDGREGLWAVSRTRRTTFYNDGTSLLVEFTDLQSVSPENCP
jgi:hypothetical protein